MIVPVDGEYAIADLSRDRYVRRTLRSVGLTPLTPIAEEKVDAKSSCEKMREVFEVAIVEAMSSIAFDAAYSRH